MLILKFITILLLVVVPQEIASQHFVAGFEGNTKVVREGSKSDDIKKGDVSDDEYYDWESDLENNPELAYFDVFQIFYQAGKKRQRKAEIVDDPIAGPSNKVLKFEVSEGYSSDPRSDNSYKLGRVAAQFYKDDVDKQPEVKGFTKLHYGFKMLLPESYQQIKNDTTFKNDWYTIVEFWNNGNWGTFEYPYRIKIDIVKRENTKTLNFVVRGQPYENGKWQRDWEVANYWYDIPLGEWLDIDIYFKEGNDRKGRLVFRVNKRTIIRAKERTHHKDASGRAIDGLTHVDMLKLYTSGEVIDKMRSLGVTPIIYWDDFIIHDGAKTHVKKSFWQSNRE